MGRLLSPEMLRHAAGVAALVDFWGVTFMIFLMRRAGDGVLHLEMVL